VVGAAGATAEACESAVRDEMPAHNASRQRDLKNFMWQPPQMWGTPQDSRKPTPLKHGGKEETEELNRRKLKANSEHEPSDWEFQNSTWFPSASSLPLCFKILTFLA
jgi:hypothetical protein